jgi:hypothetical protein
VKGEPGLESGVDGFGFGVEAFRLRVKDLGFGFGFKALDGAFGVEAGRDKPN